MAANLKPQVDDAVADVDFDANDYRIRFETTEGPIAIDLWPDVAPGHAKNIIGLTKIGFYDGILFHRVIRGFVIQAGCPQGTGTGGPGYTIDAEFNDRPHEPGVLSMARTNDPNSAGSQFFLCVGRVPHLDNQYTAFGKTADAESLDVAMKIAEIPTGAQDRPTKEVRIEKGTVEAVPKA